jgi:hypothetical protein
MLWERWGNESWIDRILGRMTMHGWMRRAVAVLSLVVALSFTGCIVVGYRSRGGWFVWPGGLGLLIVVLLVLFLLRGRR